MSTQLQINIITRPSQGTMPCRPRAEIRSVVERITMKSLPTEDLLAVEVDRLLEDVRAALDYNLDIAAEAAGRLAAILVRKLHEDSRPAPARGGLAPWQKRKIQAYIGDRLEEPLLLGDLAKVVSLSISYFSRSFKQSFGEPPHAYIIRARINRAQTLMMTTCESLSQIALACGLLDQAHLCRRFRQVTGTTPGAWRRCHAIAHSSAPSWTHSSGSVSISAGKYSWSDEGRDLSSSLQHTGSVANSSGDRDRFERLGLLHAASE
jgi:AraC family transcriptional regulator